MLQGEVVWHDAVFGYRMGNARADLSFDRRDSAFVMPKCVVVDPAVTWGPDYPPNIPWPETIIYEAHVKGMTAQNAAIPDRVRGSFAALADPRAIEHLVTLGVTAIELMPTQAFFDDRYLIEKGLTNYWGYNTIGFFAPATRYISPGGGVHEFKLMVRRLHEAGIEVILDVVYNHTAEGNHLGPTLSFKGDRQCQLLHAGRRSALLLRHDGLRKHGEPRAPAGAADGHGQFALLGRGLPCRRLPLRSGNLARARPAGVQRECGLSRRGAAGSGPEPGEADRRALGHGPRRLSARQFPSRMGRVERSVPRHGALLLEGRCGRAAGARLAASGIGRPLRPPGPASMGQREFHHRSRRVHPRRHRVLQRQSTMRRTRKETATAIPTTAAGTAARRGPPRMRRCSTSATGCGGR